MRIFKPRRGEILIAKILIFLPSAVGADYEKTKLENEIIGSNQCEINHLVFLLETTEVDQLGSGKEKGNCEKWALNLYNFSFLL